MNENIVESHWNPRESLESLESGVLCIPRNIGIPGIQYQGYQDIDISIEYNYMNCNMDNYCDYDALSTSILEFVSDCPMKLQCKSRVDSLEFAMLFEFM
jgi:hypothetical protein